MVKGLVYLTGLVTLTLVAAAGAVAYKVHTWPWGDYIKDGREALADKLDPRNDPQDDAGSFRDTGATGQSTGMQRTDGMVRRDAVDREHPVRPVDASAPSSRALVGHRHPRRGAAEQSPSPTCCAREAQAARRHTVRSGDTLYALSRRYYDDPMRWQEIAHANGIRRPSDLKVGLLIVIPRRRVCQQTAVSKGGNSLSPRLMFAPAVEAEDGPPWEEVAP